uniref:hypothetical protein n=2 Tax=Flavobacterium sp. TaxID=239 RepID=UPI00404A7979
MKDKFLNFIITYGLALGGFFVIIIGLIGIRNYYLNYEITKTNEKVTVRIIECYSRISPLAKYGRKDYFIKFEYNKKVHIKRTLSKYCKKIEGQLYIEMLVNDKKDSFIFVDEVEDKVVIISSFLLIIVGLFIAYKGLKEEIS